MRFYQQKLSFEQLNNQVLTDKLDELERAPQKTTPAATLEQLECEASLVCFGPRTTGDEVSDRYDVEESIDKIENLELEDEKFLDPQYLEKLQQLYTYFKSKSFEISRSEEQQLLTQARRSSTAEGEPKKIKLKKKIY